MKKWFIVFLLLLMVGVARAEIVSAYEIPKDAVNVLTVTMEMRWQIYEDGNLWTVGEGWGMREARFRTFREAIDAIKTKYQVIKIFKDAIDDDYFVCVKYKK